MATRFTGGKRNGTGEVLPGRARSAGGGLRRLRTEFGSQAGSNRLEPLDSPVRSIGRCVLSEQFVHIADQIVARALALGDDSRSPVVAVQDFRPYAVRYVTGPELVQVHFSDAEDFRRSLQRRKTYDGSLANSNRTCAIVSVDRKRRERAPLYTLVAILRESPEAQDELIGEQALTRLEANPRLDSQNARARLSIPIVSMLLEEGTGSVNFVEQTSVLRFRLSAVQIELGALSSIPAIEQ